MSKIRVNLTSGNVFEKPLVTCFQGTSANYVVFDNEMNGSMGLPIICISKLNGDRLEKIFDQSEWASVKENLKSIISGTTLMYLAVPENLSAQDDFFTQLTLPVASFDVLKRSYNPPQPEQEVMPAPQPEVAPAPAPTPEVMETPAPPVMDGPISFGGMNTVNTAPVMSNMGAPVMNSNPATNPAPQMMGMNDMLGQTNNMAMQNGMAPMNNSMPNVNNQMPNPSPVSNINYADLKETFMKSCENMFDALVKRFENK